MSWAKRTGGGSRRTSNGAPAAVEFGIIGFDALLAKLETVSLDMKFKGGRFALRKAAAVIVAATKAKAERFDDPRTGEKIHVNVGLRWSNRLFRRTGNLGFRVGVLGGAKKYASSSKNRKLGRVGKTNFTGGSKDRPGGDTWYWRLVEFGTAHSKAQPFMRPAMEENTGKATDVFVQEYNKAIDRAIKRAAKGK